MKKTDLGVSRPTALLAAPKSAPPYIPMYPRDFLTDLRIRALPRELKSVYIELLFSMWQDPECRLPNDDNSIAGILNVNPRTWRCKWKPVLVENEKTRLFETTEDGYFYNPWLTAQRESIAAKSATRSASAQARWSNESARAGSGAEQSVQPDMTRAERAVSGRLFDDIPQGEIVASMVLKDGTNYHVHQRDVLEMKELYPSVDVEQVLRNLEGWCKSNPGKRKTRTGIPRFLHGALGRQTTGATTANAVRPALAKGAHQFNSGKVHEAVKTDGATPDVQESKIFRLVQGGAK